MIHIEILLKEKFNLIRIDKLVFCLTSIVLLTSCAQSGSSEFSNQSESGKAVSETSDEMIINFVDFSNEEFKQTYPESWAAILSCKKFYEEDWLGAWTYHVEYDQELESRGKLRMLGLNQAFNKAMMIDGVSDSPEEMQMIHDRCKDLLISYNGKDNRIILPEGDFWEYGKYSLLN